jgi:Holliday junction DNA helicase RuvA
MIGRLRGTLAHKGVEGLVVDVGGVGYDVLVPLSVLDRLPPEGRECHLAIHTHVREDQITLFGFSNVDERSLFRLLIGVSGIGPRLALACLGLPGEELARAIRSEDLKRLSSLPGIGKRTAQRLVLELKDKLPPVFGGATPAPAPRAHALDDLESALRNLGYRPKDVEALVARLAPEAPGLAFEELLRRALSALNG